MKKSRLPGFLLVLLAGCSRQAAGPDGDFKWQELNSPAKPGSKVPNLFAAKDGRIYLSWVDKTPADAAGENPHALFYSIYHGDEWSSPQIVAAGNNWFVNWADFPSLTVLADGMIAAHWLAKSGEGTYAYDVNIACHGAASRRHAHRTWVCVDVAVAG
jgi:hypothetical protein